MAISRPRPGVFIPRLLAAAKTSVCEKHTQRERVRARCAGLWKLLFLRSVDEQQKLVISILTEWIGMGRSGTLSSAKLQLFYRISLVMVSLSLLLQPGEHIFLFCAFFQTLQLGGVRIFKLHKLIILLLSIYVIMFSVYFSHFTVSCACGSYSIWSCAVLAVSQPC